MGLTAITIVLLAITIHSRVPERLRANVRRLDDSLPRRRQTYAGSLAANRSFRGGGATVVEFSSASAPQQKTAQQIHLTRYRKQPETTVGSGDANDDEKKRERAQYWLFDLDPACGMQTRVRP